MIRMPMGLLEKAKFCCSLSLNLVKWTIEIILLVLFWTIVLPSYFSSNIFTDIELSDFIKDIILFCVKPSVDDLTRRLVTVLVMNLIFNIMVRWRRYSPKKYNLMSAITGMMLLNTNSFPRNLYLILAFCLFGFVVVLRIQYIMSNNPLMMRPVYFVSAIVCFILIVGEFFYPDYRNWTECRGVIMLMAMKLISLTTEESRIMLVTVTEYWGYMLCPATILFGPWISIQDYRLHNVVHSKLNWRWPLKMVQVLTYAMINMVISNCIQRMLVVTQHPSPWRIAIRDAWAFRCSNYFICYMAEFTMITAGFNTVTDESGNWKYCCTKPLGVEFPRSVAVVVKNWNIPVHRFLKLHIYIPFCEVGRRYAIFFTFFFSAMLHGLNLRVTLVLLSLGCLSFGQKVCQDALADKFNLCVKIFPCRAHCPHFMGYLNPLALLFNGFNMLMNWYHLAYLGCIMDDAYSASSLLEIYYKWDYDFHMSTHHALVVWLATTLMLL